VLNQDLDSELDQDTRESAADDSAGPADGAVRPGVTPAKGRPTPKRSEAEKRRRQPYSAPSDRKAAAQQSRDRGRSDRQRRMQAMRRGEEWALPRKDQGKVRGLARDYVDARRTLSEYYLFGVFALVAVLFIPGLRGTLTVDYIILGVLAVIIGEGWYTGRQVVRLAQERYPGESTRGVRLYAAMRSTQLRRMRMPPPRVKVGDKI
jgi:Protein of unknown function (DUF3043)